jgi:hypothetical protein
MSLIRIRIYAKLAIGAVGNISDVLDDEAQLPKWV